MVPTIAYYAVCVVLDDTEHDLDDDTDRAVRRYRLTVFYACL